MRRVFPVLLSTFFLVCSSVSADIVGVSSIAYVGTNAEHFSNETNLINGSGLSGTISSEADFATVTHAQAAATNAWVTTPPNGTTSGVDDFFEVGGAQGTVVFEFTLDQLYTDIDEMVNWGYHFGAAGGNFASVATLEFYSGGSGGVLNATYTDVTIASTAASSVSSTFTATDADFIRLTITDNHFGTLPNGGDRVGLAEIRFANTVAAVPEPASASLAALGLCGFGFLRRRRNRV